MSIYPATCFGEYGQILWWKVPIDQRFVSFSKKVLKIYPQEKSRETNLVRGQYVDEGYELPDMIVMGFSEKNTRVKKGNNFVYEDKGAIFVLDDNLLNLHGCWYPIRFSLPKSNLVKYETEEREIPQFITISEWAHDNCYMVSINRILENRGKKVYAFLRNIDNPVMKSEPFYEFIEKLQIRIDLRNMSIEG